MKYLSLTALVIEDVTTGEVQLRK